MTLTIRLYLFRHRYQGSTPVRRVLYRILDNLGIDHSRRTRAHSAAAHKLVATQQAEPCPSAVYESKQELLTVYRALQTLSYEQRQLIILREFHGLRYREIAAATGLGLDNVRVQIHRARRKLREALRGCPDDAGRARTRGMHLGGG